MNKKLYLSYLILIITIFLTTSCKTTREYFQASAISTIAFSFNKKGECFLKGEKRISEKEFKKLIHSSGWMWYSSNIINQDGKLEHKDYYNGIIGVSPMNYYFSENNKCTTFFFSSAYGKNVKYDYEYEYNENNNKLTIKGLGCFKIVRINLYEIWVINQIGVKENNLPQYAFTIYNRVDENELQQILLNRKLIDNQKIIF